MTLEYVEKQGRRRHARLTACPVCNHEFSYNRDRMEHFWFDHTPSDFGLTPLGGGK